MSIFVKNVTWTQTNSEVIVIVPIFGRKSTENVILAEKFLKINVQPYFYEVFFEQPICVEQSSCKILESNFKFRLKKTNDEWWNALGKTGKLAGSAGEHAISNEMKQEIFGEYEKNVKDEFAHQQKERASLKRNEIDKEIGRTSDIRQKIDETEAFLKNYHTFNNKEPKKAIEDTKPSKQHPRISTPERFEDPNKSIPPIRSGAKISVNFSSRQFVTPKRESRETDEMEWCAKQHEILVNRIGFCDEDLNSEERDMSWLIKKGNTFLDKKNYLAALSAFTCGMRVSKDSPELFLGRARAQYALKNYRSCAEDCSDALDRFKPAVESNLLGRIHCFWLRGKSLIFLGLTDHGNREIQMAAQLDPDNFEINQNRFMNDKVDTK